MVDDSHATGFVGADGPRHARALRRRGPRRHPHRHARQGARRRLRRLHQRPRARSSSCCGSARGRTCSPTRWRRSIAAASLTALDLIEDGDELRDAAGRATPRASARGMAALGFTLGRARPPDHPGDARRRRARRRTGRRACSTRASTSIGFSFPVVPQGQARIRTQMSAAHTAERRRPRGRRLRRGRPRARSDPMGATHERAGQGAARAGPLDGGGAGARARPERRADQGREERDLRHRRAHLELGRVGGGDRAGADGGRPRVHRRDRRRSAAPSPASSRATASRARGTSSAASAATAAPGKGHLCRNTSASACNRPGSFAEYLCIPERNVVRSPTTCPTRSPRSSTRSATPCTPRSASIWSARTCWSPAPGRSASWARWSPSAPARARW